MGHEELPFAPGLTATTRVANPEPRMEKEGPQLQGFGKERHGRAQQPGSPKKGSGSRGHAGSSSGRPFWASSQGSFTPGKELQVPGGRCVKVLQQVVPLRWGELPLALPRPIPRTTLAALGRVFNPPPPSLRDVVEGSLVMGLCRAYTGLAKDLVAIIATRGEWRDIPPVALLLVSQGALSDLL